MKVYNVDKALFLSLKLLIMIFSSPNNYLIVQTFFHPISYFRSSLIENISLSRSAKTNVYRGFVVPNSFEGTILMPYKIMLTHSVKVN